MADRKVTELASKTDLIDSDIFYVVDSVDSTDKKTNLEEIKKSVFTINYTVDNDANKLGHLQNVLDGVSGTTNVSVGKYLVVNVDDTEYYLPLFSIAE